MSVASEGGYVCELYRRKGVLMAQTLALFRVHVSQVQAKSYQELRSRPKVTLVYSTTLPNLSGKDCSARPS
jgi:hypothetical protein